MFPIAKIRRDFPLLEKGIIYFDNAASSLTPIQVIKAIEDYYLNYRANISRGIYSLSREATLKYEKTREKIAKFINSNPEEIIFTRNTTESINIVANGLNLSRGGKIITTIFEHHSNLLPWLRLREKGIEVEIISPKSVLDFLLELEESIDSRTRLIAMSHVSNVIGNIFPIEKVGKICRDEGILLLVDGAQSAPHLEIDVKKLNCDFFAFSAHKMLGPTGVGCLYIREEIFSELKPTFLGGGTVEDVPLPEFELFKNFSKFEYGTPNISGVIGLGEAINYLSEIRKRNCHEYEKKLFEKLFRKIRDLSNLELYCPEIPLRERIPILPFNIKGKNPEKVAKVLDKNKICVRSGHHCAIPLIKKFLKIDGCVRASLYFYNTYDEIEKFVETLESLL